MTTQGPAYVRAAVHHAVPDAEHARAAVAGAEPSGEHVERGAAVPHRRVELLVGERGAGSRPWRSGAARSRCRRSGRAPRAAIRPSAGRQYTQNFRLDEPALSTSA